MKVILLLLFAIISIGMRPITLDKAYHTDAPPLKTLEYVYPEYIEPEPTPAHALYVYDRNKAPIEMPIKMAKGATAVFLKCEVKQYSAIPGYDLSTVVGKYGERGQAQIHPIHTEEMNSLGLKFSSERDRLLFAVHLWEREGWKPWSCRHMLGIP